MGLLSVFKTLLRKKLSTASMIASVGGMVRRRFFREKRNHWQKMDADQLETVLDILTAYDMARGAGKLITGLLRFSLPRQTLSDLDRQLRQTLEEMDQKDDSLYDRARSRLIASKAMFYAEGLQWKSCRYEWYQQEALDLLQQIPAWKTLGRTQIFQAQPFAPEEIIGTTHRMLLMLGNHQTEDFISAFLKQKRINSDPDYMARLLALTLNVQEPKQFEQVMLQWLKDYRDFKLSQVSRQERWVDMSMSVISGKMPARFGFSLLNGILKAGWSKARSGAKP
jgi:hypothetical protein